MLIVNLPPETYEKFDRFKQAKILDSNPLTRYCPKAGCSTHIVAENDSVESIQCPKCETKICFNCRDVWHGEDVTCEEALNKQLAGWAEEN